VSQTVSDSSHIGIILELVFFYSEQYGSHEDCG